MSDFEIKRENGYTSIISGSDKIFVVSDKLQDTGKHTGKDDLILNLQTREVLKGKIDKNNIQKLITAVAKELQEGKNNTIDRSYGEELYYLLSFLQGDYYNYMEKLYTDIDTTEGHVWNLDDKIEYRERLIEKQNKTKASNEKVVTIPALKKASLDLKELYTKKNNIEEQVKLHKRQKELFSQALNFLEQYDTADTATQKSLEKKYEGFVKKCIKQGCRNFNQASLEQKVQEVNKTLGSLTTETEQYYSKITEQNEVYTALKHTVLFSNPVDIEITSTIFEHDKHIVALQEQRNELEGIYKSLKVEQDDLIKPFFALYTLRNEKSKIAKEHGKMLSQGKKLLAKDPILEDRQHARTGNAIGLRLQHGYIQLENVTGKIKKAKMWYNGTSGGKFYMDRSKSMKEKLHEMTQKAQQLQGRILQIQNELAKKRKQVAGLHESNRQLIVNFEAIYTTPKLEQTPIDIKALRNDIDIYTQQKDIYLEQLLLLQEKLHKEITFFMKKQGLDQHQKAYLVEYLHRIPALYSEIDEIIDLLYTYKDHLKPTKIDNMRVTQRRGTDLGNEYYKRSTDKDTLAKTWIEDRIVYDEDAITERENDLYTDFEELTDERRNQPEYRVVYDIKGKSVPLSNEVRSIGEVLFSLRDKALQQHIHVDEFMQALGKLEPQINTAIESLDQQRETPYKLMKNACKIYISFIHKAKHYLTTTDYGRFLLLRAKLENTYTQLVATNQGLTSLQNTKEPRLPDFSLDDVSIIVPRTRNKGEKPAISQIGTLIQQMRSYKQGREVQENMLKSAVKLLEEDMQSYKGYT